MNVNLQVLDKLCLDFLEFSENGSKDSFEISVICQLVRDGRLQDALTELNTFKPGLFQDEEKFPPQLRKKWEKQTCIETIRTADSLQDCLKTLQRFATENFDFDRSFVLAMFYKGRSDSPVFDEFSLDKRQVLAAEVQSFLEYAADVIDPQLCLTLRYLTLVVNMHFALRGEDPPIPLIERLILPDRKEALMLASTKKEFIPISESDINHLCQVVSISPAQAETALRNKRGSLNEALILELMRIKIDLSILKEIVLEYCDFRGLSTSNSFLSPSPVGKKRNLEGHPLDLYPKDQLSHLQQLQTIIKETHESWAKIPCGKISEIIESIEKFAPTFFSQNPFLNFIFKRWLFLDLSRNGVTSEAIRIIQTDLAKLAKQHPELQNLFTETSHLIICPPSILDLTKYVPEHIPSDIYASLAQYIGLKEPKLLEIMEKLLKYHEESFKEQFKDDQFEKLFGISALKESDVPHQEPFLKEDSTSVPQYFDPSQISKAEEDANSAGLNDDDIISVMDILACSRLEAINLLLQHGGNLSEALAVIFGT